ncbi:hypothetical protein DDT52_10580 [Brenneria roseae subsp. roseae]|uniref:hypothetical protein n=1 Tax=Brenneria roseae TaxID=1509241 RepID=UPI000D60E327|nr:hypothetical protein [Brenneria roseae]PWC20300.1 hypothetical protein DDT52_10580 [Brenneria roseae subsp. roseae]
MNKPLLVACSLSFLTFFIHVFKGGPKIHDAIIAGNVSDYVSAVGSVVWHATSAILFINSIALFYAAQKQVWRKSVTLLVFAQYLAFTVLFLGYGFARFGSVLVVPHWMAFAVILFLALWGLSSSREKT